MRRKLAAALILACLTSSGASALTMDEAVSLALKNNPRVKQFAENAKAAEERKGLAETPFMPVYSVGYSYAEIDQMSPDISTEGSKASVEIGYNLFNGFRDQNNLKSAESAALAAKYEKAAIEADISLDTRKAYIEALRAEKNVETAKEAVASLESHLKDVRLFYDNGLVARNQVLKVEVELSSARQTLNRAESGARISRLALDRLIGAKAEGLEPLPDGTKVAFIPDSPSMKEFVIKNRSELKYLLALRASKVYSVDSIKGNDFPSLNLAFNYSQFGDSYGPVGRDELPDTELGLMFSVRWEVFNESKRSHELGAANAELASLDRAIEDTRDKLMLQLDGSLESYRLAESSIAVAAKAVEQAAENYRITQSQFKERAATTTDLLDARFLLTRARNEYTGAQFDLQNALSELERIVETPLR